MALPDFTSRAHTILRAVTDMQEIISHLQGGSGKTDAWHFRCSTGNNYLITLSDSAGARKFSVRDSGGNEIFAVNSDGDLTISGTFTPSGALVLPVATSPAQTADGSVVWDSNDDILTVGDGSSRKTFYPGQVAKQERWHVDAGPAVNAAALAALTANTAYLLPLVPLTQNRTIASIIVELGGSTDDIDAGIYSYDGTTFTRVVSLGATAFPGTGKQVLNIDDTALTMGTRYFLALSAAGTTATFYSLTSAGVNTIDAYTKATSHPLPATITSATAAGFSNPTPVGSGVFA